MLALNPRDPKMSSPTVPIWGIMKDSMLQDGLSSSHESHRWKKDEHLHGIARDLLDEVTKCLKEAFNDRFVLRELGSNFRR